MRQKFWQLDTLAAGVLLVLSNGVAYAAQPPDAGRVLESIKEPAQPPKPAPDISVQQPARPALQAQPGLSVKVTAFKITGNTIFPESELLPLLESYVGNELKFDDLQGVVGIITAHYRKNGYFLAHAYLPAQEIKGGVVEIVILEGRVGQPKLHLNKNSNISESVAMGFVEQIKPGDLITETGLERPLLLLSDLPGVKVKSTLAPGAVVGTADVVVDVADDGHFVAGDVGLDNAGGRFTGEYRMNAGVSINNPSGLGDTVTLRGTASDTGGLKLGRLSYTIPVFSQGTKIGANYSDLTYSIGKDFANLQAHGTATVFDVFVQHPFTRSRNFNLFGQLGYNQKNLKDLIDSTGSFTDKDLKMITVGIGGDSRDDFGGGGLNTFSFAYTGGKLDIKKLGINPPGNLTDDRAPAGHDTNGSYDKYNYGLTRLQHLTEGLALMGNLSGQFSSKNLDSSEKFTLGGPNGVRAYPVGEAPADEGYILTAELRQTFHTDMVGGEFMAFGFVDAGHAQAFKKPLATDTNNKRDLSAYGLGLSWGETANFIVKATVAWKGSNNMPTADVDRDPRAWFNLTKWF